MWSQLGGRAASGIHQTRCISRRMTTPTSVRHSRRNARFQGERNQLVHTQALHVAWSNGCVRYSTWAVKPDENARDPPPPQKKKNPRYKAPLLAGTLSIQRLLKPDEGRQDTYLATTCWRFAGGSVHHLRGEKGAPARNYWLALGHDAMGMSVRPTFCPTKRSVVATPIFADVGP